MLKILIKFFKNFIKNTPAEMIDLKKNNLKKNNINLIIFNKILGLINTNVDYPFFLYHYYKKKKN